MKGRYTYDIQHRVIKKDENYLARLTDKDAHKITDELNRQDTIINKYERTISKIRKISACQRLFLAAGTPRPGLVGQAHLAG